MRTLPLLALSIALVAALSGQSPKQSVTPVKIYPDSRNRLPVVHRDQMDENGKRVYDINAHGAGKIAQPTGPSAIALYSPGAAEPLRRLNDYLRRDDSILGRHVIEVAILVTSRELDSQYVWTSHEPSALKAGVAQAVVDAIKYGKDASGLADKDALVIRMGRQLFREHKLNPDLFAKSMEVFGRQGTVELVALMGDYAVNGLLVAAFDQQVPAGQKPLLPPR